MIEYTKAFIVGGWSECPGDLERLAYEITEGEHRFASEVEAFSLASVLERIKGFAEEAKRRVVVTHSAGAMAVEGAGALVTMNGPEPTPFKRLAQGALLVATHGVGHHEYALPTALKSWEAEICRRSTLTIPLRVTRFSTIKKLISGLEAGEYPGGCAYLVGAKDEFGFGSHKEVDLAASSGIPAAVLPGRHNTALISPAGYVEQIAKFVTRVPEAA